MKYLLLTMVSVVFNLHTNAQFSSVSIKVDGLTCSACSFSTQKSLLELDFVDTVKMDLENNIAVVTFKPSKKIEINRLAQKVVDAGFSVGKLTADFNFNSITTTDGCYEYESDMYQWATAYSEKLLGQHNILFVGKKYMDKAELKQWKDSKPKSNCKTNEGFKGQIYIVALQ